MIDTPRPTLLVDARCTLGEGIVWDARQQAILWTDIERSTIWIHYFVDGSTQSWQTPDRVGSFAICRSGRLLLALAKGIYVADLPARADAPLAATLLAPVETHIATTRTNDGRADRAGNFVFGTYNEDAAGAALGAFYQYSTRHGLRVLDLGPVATANSICFSADNETMFFCDSPSRRIMRCRYDAARAQTSDVRPFIVFGQHQGMPDGSIVDADGCLWNAEWGTGTVRRYDSAGALIQTIEVPAKHATCPAFGGSDLSDLFVTSARQGLTPEELARQPESGGIHHVRIPGARGLADAPFADS